jgi:virginiamycin B lyase
MRRTRLGLAWVLVVLASGCCASQAGAYVYWTNSESNSIGRANLDGSGADQSFITGATNPDSVVVDGQYIYWINNGGDTSGDGTIGRANLDGSGVEESFITGLSFPDGVAVNGQYIYWTNDGDRTIGRANLDGSGVNQSFITGASEPAGLAINSQHIYWTNQETATIGRANLDGSEVEESFITGTTGPFGVTINDQHIYWANRGNNTIGRANLDGTGVDQSFIANAGGATGLALDSRYLYWTEDFSGAGESTIARANLDGSTPDPSLISGASGPFAVAVDAGPAGTATPSAPSLTFASQPLDTYSTPQTLTITNTGDGQLQLGQASVTGGDNDDFLTASNTCSGATLWTDDTCTIGVRFGPTAANGRSATLTLTSNDPASPLSITLQGTGGSLPEGPPGANGTNGTNGAAGPIGLTGVGPVGPVGPQGPAGQIELAICKPVTTGRGKHKKTTQKCSTQLEASPVTFTTTGALVAAVLRRGKIVYATGRAIGSGSSTKLLLTQRQAIANGVYTLTLRRGRHLRSETVTID